MEEEGVQGLLYQKKGAQTEIEEYCPNPRGGVIEVGYGIVTYL